MTLQTHCATTDMPTPDTILIAARQALASVLRTEPDRLDVTAHFSDLGLDSLLGLRFARRLADSLGRDIDPEWLYDHPTLERLGSFLASPTADSTPQ